MPQHPAIASGRAAVVTGAASGIGFAAAAKLAGLGMNICMADANAAALEAAVANVSERVGSKDGVIGVPTDVSKREEIERLKARAYEAFGEVALLMNNAGLGGKDTKLFSDPDRWRAVLDTNLWGVIHGVQVFAPAMMAQTIPSAIVNTGSKQGITCPPGEAAYNVSKAGVKVVTEALAHELRNTEGCRVSAHLLIPGYTFTGITSRGRTEKPRGAWTAGQVVDLMLERLAAGDFYILCPDNDVSRAMDEKRMRWAMDDVVLNRPALSRWHPDFKDTFEKYMAE